LIILSLIAPIEIAILQEVKEEHANQKMIELK
jgi:hypothetical protein